MREAYPGDEPRLRRMSIIAGGRAVRMAYLATVAGSKVNGVAELHSQLLRDKVLPDFSEYWPDKFTNVTNGVTPRRFVRLANQDLSALITDGHRRRLAHRPGPAVGAGAVRRRPGVPRAVPRGQEDQQDQPGRAPAGPQPASCSPADAMLDVMVKRLHEYKRQTLKLLHIVTLYQQIRSGEVKAEDVTPRVFVFGAKAAPGYRMAKQIIGLINAVGETVNNDPLVKGRLTVVFPPNYNVTLAEKLIPAADLSEQISLAGKEASGTGNMKLALNGALTIGTDDGANVEIRKLVGDDNFFLFGLLRAGGRGAVRVGLLARPATTRATRSCGRAIDLIASGAFSDGDRMVFEPVVSNLLGDDRFLALADYRSYIDAQDRVDKAYADQDAWTRSAILNVARCGFFSSDRAMRDYIDRIWHTQPVLDD